MKVEVIYDRYNTKIDRADLIFTDALDVKSKISLQTFLHTEMVGDVEVATEKVKITSVDGELVQIENDLDKDDLRVLMSIMRNLLSQIN